MLLGRSQTQEARAVLRALSRRFLGLRTASLDASLAGGHAGLALVHAALDATFPDEGHASRAARALDRAVHSLAATPMSPGLFSGFSGVAWVAEFLQGNTTAPTDDDPITPIDQALEIYLAQSPWVQPYDLIQGLVGIGVYALERMPRASAKRLVVLVVNHLADTAKSRRPGIAWRTDPEWVPKRWRRTPHPDWNLGVSHGVPGVIALLGKIAAADVDGRTKKTARALLEKAVTWLLAQELPPGAGGCFAYAVAPGLRREPERLAWCHGDPGVAATLLVAARAARKPAWEKEAIRIALRAAERSEPTAHVRDAGLCHGAAGVAHIFHRLFLTTGEERLAEAARFWFARTIAMRQDQVRQERRGFAGFAAYVADAKGNLAWRPDAGFLTGAAGITLALLAATARTPHPAWDRALLLS